MATITLSSKHQVTLPVDMVRSLGLKAGDKLVAELIEDHIVLLPQPESWTDYIRGSMKGVYGSTLEEIDAYIENERHSPERWEWKQQVKDLVATDRSVRVVVEVLKNSPNRTASFLDLSKHPLGVRGGLDGDAIEGALAKLTKHGAVRKIPTQRANREVYRLVREFAGP